MRRTLTTRDVCRIHFAAALCLLVALFHADGSSAATVRVAVISDINGAYGNTHYEPAAVETLRRLVEMKPDLVISTGDMVAGQRLHPPLRPQTVEAMWAAFHSEVTDPLRNAGISLAVTPGNHDASAYGNFALERRIYREQWLARIPGLNFVDQTNYPFDYAFSVGEVLFVSLDATREGALEERQRRWLDGLLEREGAAFRHRVVFSHLPVYPFSQGRETDVTADRKLEQLLHRHRVELYLSGHHHAFYPGYRDGVRFVGQACLGAGPRKLIGAEEVSQRAVTWLEFEGGRLTVTALIVPRLDRAVDLNTLPRSISTHFGTLVREDLRQAGTADGLKGDGH